MAGDVKTQRYRAFITYSHRDKRWAAWLHRRLESYRVPRRLVGKRTPVGIVPRRLTPIFRDREELATADDLGERLTEALARSDSLIVVCSPAAARSRWVNEEVLRFRRARGNSRILCLIVAGEPFASFGENRKEDECLPPALRYRADEHGTLTGERAEPLAADARPGGDRRRTAKLKLIGGLLGLDLDELRRRELQRRNRRLAALTAGALVVTAATSLLAIEAVIQRNAAERRQRQAENLVSFMLGSLTDKLHALGRLNVLASIDEKAMKYFESLPPGDVNRATEIQRAHALEEIGNTRFDQGDFDEAMEAFRAELVLTAALAKKYPGDAERQDALGGNYAWLGYANYSQGNMEEAERSFRHAAAALEAAVALAPSNTAFQADLAETYANLGNVAEQRGEAKSAHADFLRYLQISARLVAAEPARVRWQDDLGNAYNNLGKLAVARGDFLEAVSDYREDQQITAMLVARHASDQQERFYSVKSTGALGRTLYFCGEWKLGIEYVREAVRLATQLVAFDPTHTDWRADRAMYSSLLAGMVLDQGDLDDADSLVKASLADLEILTKKDPSYGPWQSGLAQARLVAARIAQARRDEGAAQGLANAAVTALEPVLKAGTGKPDETRTAATALLLLADLAEKDPSPATAEVLRQRAADLVQQISVQSRDPQNMALEVAVDVARGNIGRALPLVQRLWRTGYRIPAFVAMLEAHGISYPVNTTFTLRIKQLAGAGETAKGDTAGTQHTASSTSSSQPMSGGYK